MLLFEITFMQDKRHLGCGNITCWCKVYKIMNDFRMNYIIEELPDVKFSSMNAVNPHGHNLKYISSESSGESLTGFILCFCLLY